MPDINVNINGDDAARAAQAADEAALRAEAAAAAGNASANRLQRAQQAHGLNELRRYQSALKKYGTLAGGAYAFEPLPELAQGGTVKPKYSTRKGGSAINPTAWATGGGDTIQGATQGGSSGGGGGTRPPVGGSNNVPRVNKSGGFSDSLSGWRQAGWGTNKSNLSGGSGIGGNFGKSAIGGISSAKARSVYNLATNLSAGSMPVILRTSLALWMVQKAAQVGGDVYEAGMKGITDKDPAKTVALKFSENLIDSVKGKLAGLGDSVQQGGINLMKFIAVGTAGLAAYNPASLIASGGDPNSVSGSILQWSQQFINKTEAYWIGGKVKAMKERAAADSALAEAAAAARSAANQYIMDFADRNADELAALGFGTGQQIRGLVASRPAAAMLQHNAVNAVLRKSGADTQPDFEPSAGDD